MPGLPPLLFSGVNLVAQVCDGSRHSIYGISVNLGSIMMAQVMMAQDLLVQVTLAQETRIVIALRTSWLKELDLRQLCKSLVDRNAYVLNCVS